VAQLNHRTKAGFDDALTFGRPSEPNFGSTALDLVKQAAELFNEIDERVREKAKRTRKQNAQVQIKEFAPPRFAPS
jgi:hypothetical protein